MIAKSDKGDEDRPCRFLHCNYLITLIFKAMSNENIQADVPRQERGAIEAKSESGKSTPEWPDGITELMKKIESSLDSLKADVTALKADVTELRKSQEQTARELRRSKTEFDVFSDNIRHFSFGSGRPFNLGITPKSYAGASLLPSGDDLINEYPYT